MARTCKIFNIIFKKSCRKIYGQADNKESLIKKILHVLKMKRRRKREARGGGRSRGGGRGGRGGRGGSSGGSSSGGCDYEVMNIVHGRGAIFFIISIDKYAA